MMKIENRIKLGVEIALRNHTLICTLIYNEKCALICTPICALVNVVYDVNCPVASNSRSN